MKVKFLLWPLFSLFLIGCNGQGSPFADDEYKPKGLTPTHQIVRALSQEEADLLANSVVVSDAYLTSANVTMESRSFGKKALPKHITASSCDERTSISLDGKRYENDVMVYSQTTLDQQLYTGTLVTNATNLNYYATLNQDKSEITTTIDITNEGGDRSVTSNASPYSDDTDYNDYFVFDFESQIWDEYGSGLIGVTNSGSLASITANTMVSDIAGAAVMDDGSRFIIETNSLLEICFLKGVLDDEVTEYYYVSYARSYVEYLIVSDEIPNVIGEPISYLSQPILLAYNEQVIQTSIATNGNFVTSQIPEPTL